MAPFPKVKYPLEDHVQENSAEEKRCLDEVKFIGLSVFKKEGYCRIAKATLFNFVPAL